MLYEKLTVAQPLELLRKRIQEVGLGEEKGAIRISRKAVLRQGRPDIKFSGYHRLFNQVIESPHKICRGRLILYQDRAEFIAPQKTYRWPANTVTCITTNGHYFEFKIQHRPFFQIHFAEESPLKHEIICRKWLQEFYTSRNARINIVEYQPVVRFSPPEPASRCWQIPEDVKEEKESWLEKLIISVVQKLTKTALRLWIKVKIHQPENWDKNRTGIVIVNHQSGLDPFIIGAFLDRKIAFLTKSTSFAHVLPRYCLKWLMGLPTTRYQTDPAVIYTIKKILGAGIKVGIFPEGERTWKGKMQPFKLSLVKVLTASRQPVYPLILKNAFLFWPRWAKFPRRATVDIYSGAPFCLVPNLYSIDEQRQFLESYFRRILGE